MLELCDGAFRVCEKSFIMSLRAYRKTSLTSGRHTDVKKKKKIMQSAAALPSQL